MTDINRLQPMPLGSVHVTSGPFAQRFEANRAYLRKLKHENLVQNHLFEASLWGPSGKPSDDIHWGWEAPNSHVRSHFLGHWMSAAYRTWRIMGDNVLKARADAVVDELERCQRENGGEWVAGVPEKYLHRIARGQSGWAPQYVVCRTLWGLLEAYTIGGNTKALDVLVNAARWFERWTSEFTKDAFDDILDYETNGMLELWTDLYAITARPEHLALVRAYDRRRLFDPIREGTDLLTNRHANTTIPEILGAARAWEVTGEDRWREAVEAYWRLAVTERGAYVTGGQSAGEFWTPPFQIAARLGDKTQEHCTVFNMVRLASFLLRWTGDATYADYIERNVYNGLLAQQHPASAMMAYFMPMRPGSRKIWGTETQTFWCCTATGVQTGAIWDELAWHSDADGLVLTQYFPTKVSHGGAQVELIEGPARSRHTAAGQVDLQRDEGVERRNEWHYHLRVTAETPQEFAIRLRIPSWVQGKALIDGQANEGPWATVRRTWSDDTVDVVLPKAITAEPVPDDPSLVGYLDGPVVLAGLVDGERVLPDVESIVPDNEREWFNWTGQWRTKGLERNFRLVPLHTVDNEPFAIYFNR